MTEGLKASLHLRAQTPASCHRRPCLCEPEEVRVCSLSICLLSGCGAARRSVQVNKIPPRAASLLIFRFSRSSALLSSSRSPDSALPLPVRPWPSSSSAWEKLTAVSQENLSARRAGDGGGQALTAFTPVWGFSFKKECVCVKIYIYLSI